MADERRLDHADGGEVSPRQRDRDLAALARNRHRVVSAAELRRIGFSARQIDLRLGGGRLVQRHRGVYAVGPGALDQYGELTAAALLAAPEGAVSHWPAAWLLQLTKLVPGRIIDVTCPRRIQAPDDIRSHRSALSRDERTVLKSIPVTTTGRTILDCAASATPRQLERMLNEAFVRRLPIRPALAALLDRHPRRRGAATVRAALERFGSGRTPTESDLEERYLEFIDRYGLPRPRTNHPVETHLGTFRVDCYWPAERLAIEIDAPSTHGSRPTMLSDRRRDRALTLAGCVPGRVMDEDLDDEPALAAELRALLAAARRRRA